uniref:brain acid soluble protein 1-like n=1 Tax=Euleptes europaea TaxID=460621 RepID=UPI00253F89CB|nr:brain acid soluble protein 1-like [Euleptes europaea]
MLKPCNLPGSERGASRERPIPDPPRPTPAGQPAPLASRSARWGSRRRSRPRPARALCSGSVPLASAGEEGTEAGRSPEEEPGGRRRGGRAEPVEAEAPCRPGHGAAAAAAARGLKPAGMIPPGGAAEGSGEKEEGGPQTPQQPASPASQESKVPTPPPPWTRWAFWARGKGVTRGEEASGPCPALARALGGCGRASGGAAPAVFDGSGVWGRTWEGT